MIFKKNEKVINFCKNKLSYDNPYKRKDFKLYHFIFSKDIFFIIWYFFILIFLLYLLKFFILKKYASNYFHHINDFKLIQSLFSNSVFNSVDSLNLNN